MLVIRLQRTGRENTPSYRIVLAEKTTHAKKGAQEVFGHYLPSRENPVFECDQSRVDFWIKRGAQPSDTVARLLTKAGMKGLDKFIQRYAKRKKKGEEAAAPAAATPAPAAEAKAEEPKTEPAKEETKA